MSINTTNTKYLVYIEQRHRRHRDPPTHVLLGVRTRRVWVSLKILQYVSMSATLVKGKATPSNWAIRAADSLMEYGATMLYYSKLNREVGVQFNGPMRTPPLLPDSLLQRDTLYAGYGLGLRNITRSVFLPVAPQHRNAGSRAPLRLRFSETNLRLCSRNLFCLKE